MDLQKIYIHIKNKNKKWESISSGLKMPFLPSFPSFYFIVFDFLFLSSLIFPSLPMSSLLFPSLPLSSPIFPFLPLSFPIFSSLPFSPLLSPYIPLSSLLFPSLPLSSLFFPSLPLIFPYLPFSSPIFPFSRSLPFLIHLCCQSLFRCGWFLRFRIKLVCVHAPIPIGNHLTQ